MRECERSEAARGYQTLSEARQVSEANAVTSQAKREVRSTEREAVVRRDSAEA